jgi:hypothetical protein
MDQGKFMWMMNPPYVVKAMTLAVQIACKNGRKNWMPDFWEFAEVYARHPEWIEPLGATDQDIDLMVGNLRENGLKVRHINEEFRKKID